MFYMLNHAKNFKIAYKLGNNKNTSFYFASQLNMKFTLPTSEANVTFLC